MLDKNFIEERKQDLLKQKAELEEELGKLAVKDDDHFHPKFPSLGNEEEDNELEVAEYDQSVDAEKRLSKLFGETKEALERIENGTYGYCENCNKEIDSARLKAFPQATTCLGCENK